MAIEIVSFPMKNGGSFHGYVSLPEGMYEPSKVSRSRNDDWLVVLFNSTILICKTKGDSEKVCFSTSMGMSGTTVPAQV